MSDPEVNVVITIDGKQYTAGVKKAADETDKLGDQAKDTAKDVDGFSKRVKKAGKETNKFGGQAKNTGADVNHLKGAVKLLAGAFVAMKVAQTIADLKDTALQAEALGNKLRFAVGGSEEAANAMNFVREESNRLGLELLSQADAYASIAAASKGTRLEGEATREIYLGVAEASAALSLTMDQSSGAMRALEQIMSKGTVQAEELRGQLGERIPGAFQIAARSMNVTTAELGKMLERGEVMSDEFLPRFAAELRKTFGDDATQNADSARASFNRLDTAFFELKATLGEGLNETLSDTAGWLTTLIEKTNELVGGGQDGFAAGLNGWERQIVEIAERLQEAEAELADEKSDRFSFNPFGPDFHARVAAAQAKVDAIKNMMVEVNRNYNQFGNFDRNTSQTESASTEPVADPTAVKSGNSLQQNLQRQIALYGQVGEATKVRYATEHGALKTLNPAQKKRLIDMADELDSIKANDAAVREAIDTQNEAIETDRQLAAAKREAMQAGLESVEMMTATETEQENQRYQLALEQLQAAEEAKLQTLIGYDELRERLKIEHESRLTGITQQGLSDREKFQQMSAMNQTKTVLGFMSGVLGSAARHNKKLFKINKIVGVANATISMYEGVMKAWAMGPILGPILAPIVAAAGLVNIRAIKNASFGGGGAVGTYSASPSTGLPTANADPYARSASAGGQSARSSSGGGVSYFNFVGSRNDSFSGEQVEQMLDAVEEATERGDRILFTRNSRQGLELTEGLENVA